ncbi:MAG: molybdopterin-dependent oxidoreductase [Desulfobacterales bacterium]|jgi:anaerobic dimethyl sulfoxide reductase subunit A|nr:molybdopterin-dependent oxidoreductase [Desulfobacterales bacterium]MDP6807777.1 molybdopterin-dependent oxidoreductase [Desulfobacterales bacterium]|tara:strand:+ start:30851 stop:33070 length:2220 start_codon:yes stop_codon:yes gene_type:complete
MNFQSTNPIDGDVKIVRATCTLDCGGRCPLRLYVKNNRIIRVEGDDAEEPEQLRTCLRCRAYRQMVHHPERLLYPQKRIGAKGTGEFERISWDEAYQILAGELTRVKETYGNEGILLATGGGYLGSLHNGGNAAARLLAQFGGFVTHYGNLSSEGAVWASLTQYGSVMVGNSREDLLNSKMIILWGWDPARMISGTNTMYHLIKAKENGAKIIAIDPRYHDTAATLADKWIPIRPGTDTAVMVAMANVMIKENLHDQAFLDRYTVGFDKFKAYVLGQEDGVDKTPSWAAEISGVDAAAIEDLAREYATTEPVALMDCQGPARSAMGEQYNRCAATLCAMTGNVGRSGGSAGGGLMGIPVGHMFRMSSIPPGKNPFELDGPRVKGTLDIRLRVVKRIHVNKIFDAILRGKAGGSPADIKMAWSMCNNYLNQTGNSNKAAKALHKLEFFCVNELFMTAQARYADLVLPVTSAAERSDLTMPWPSGPYFAFVNRALEPLGECKSDLDIASELAEHLGIKDFNPHTEEEWLKMLVELNPEYQKHIKGYHEFKKDGIHRIKLPKPIVAFQEQIEDPENHPFDTPSGKIEIYSQRVADLNNPLCPPIPKYMSTPEDRNDPLIEQYPLQLLTPHAKNRVHSELYNVEWLREVEAHRAWINPIDADPRGVGDGDEIYVFNDRGKVAIPAWVTERIIPGVICIFEGAWYAPDENGIDRGACANTLTNDAYSDGGAAVMNSSLVQVQRA